MKAIERFVKLAASGVLVTSLIVNFSACTDQSPLSPAVSQTDVDGTTLGKKSGKGKRGDTATTYPQSASYDMIWDKDLGGYQGGNMHLENGSKFHVNDGSFTPPRGTGKRKPVTLTMLVEKNDQGELIYTFGPSGSHFDPPAEIRLKWGEVSNREPNLYYISEDGSYIEQQTSDIDKKGKSFILYVHHFSRYAVAWSH